MIIDGQKIANELEAKLKLKVKPGLTLGILVFDNDRAGQVYSRLKTEAAKRLGIEVVKSSRERVLSQWAVDPAINGILIQYPGWQGRGAQAKWDQLVQKIPLGKDVDGLRPDSPFVPATVRAVETIINHISPRGGILVVGRGLVGRALAKRLKTKSISSRDPDLTEKCRQADIIVTACGKPGTIKTVKPGAVVIDCGWPKGDADFEIIKNIAGAITPVPGGVGPVTVICLLENLVEAVYNRL